MRSASTWGLLGVISSLMGCGAKTGLRLPDVAPDIAPDAPAMDVRDVTEDDAADVPPELPSDVCAPRVVPVQRQVPTVLLVLDRSGSMSQDLQGSSGTPSRWDVLQTALGRSLPRFDRTIEMGLMLFPASSATGLCSVSATVDLRPQVGNGGAILSVLRRSSPTGRTPTSAALQSAARWFELNVTGARSRQIVLATDGAPNCNERLDGLTCVCTGLGTTSTNECAREPELCLVHARTVEAARALAARGIATYVIGIDGDRRRYLVDVLNALATAGGRPNQRSPERRYYSVQQPQDLDAAFETIQRTIVDCNLVASARPREMARVRFELDGEEVPHDPARRDGWDWSTPDGTTLTLYGGACERAQRGARTLNLRVLCE